MVKAEADDIWVVTAISLIPQSYNRVGPVIEGIISLLMNVSWEPAERSSPSITVFVAWCCCRRTSNGGTADLRNMIYIKVSAYRQLEIL